ncbi:hypothetical protein N9Z41_01600 [bacterium]|nr:hypothetical protein [bacterium]
MFKQIWEWIKAGYIWLCKLNMETSEAGAQWDAANERLQKKKKLEEND